MKLRTLNILILSLLSAPLMAQAGANQIKAKRPQEKKEATYEHPGFLEKWYGFLGLTGGYYNNSLYEDQEDISEINPRVFGGLRVSLGGGFSLASSYYLKASTDQKSETNRDEDIQDASGKNIRLVEREIEYEVTTKDHIRYQIEYALPINNKNLVRIYTGYSQYNESHFSERYDMTDRDKPILFSNHNRYYLTQDTNIRNENYHAGANWFYKERLSIGLGYTFSKRSENSNVRNIVTQGEEISFDESDFAFARGVNDLIKDQHTIEFNISLIW